MPDTSFYTQANPNALMQTAQGALAIRGQQIANTQAHQDLVKGQVSYLTNGLGALASKPDLSPDDMLSFGKRAVDEGIISPQTYQAEAAMIAQAGNDPAKLRQVATQYLMRAQSAGDQYAAAFGMSPSGASDLVTYPGPTGATVTTTRRNFVNAVNGSGAGPANPFLAQPSAPGNPLTGGDLHPLGGEGAAAKAPVPLAPLPQSANAGAAGGIAGPTPQQQQQFEASSQQQQGDLTGDASYIQTVNPLKKIIATLPNTPLFGEGAQFPTELSKILNTYGITIGADQANNSAELEKYMTQLARSSGAAANTNEQLLTSIAANPNMTMTKASAGDVARVLLSLARMKHAQVLAAQQEGVAPEDYSKWVSTEWAKGQDPRAYAFDLMDDKAKTALRTELEKNPDEAKRFINSYNMANQFGILGNSAQ